MEQKRLRLYHIDMKYVRDLAKVDDNVLSISPQVGKASRPFVGIVILCNQYQYCIPLASPKEKHKSMKNDVDFTKIIVKDKLIGVLNFNNMIPVDETVLVPLDLKIHDKDDTAARQYKIVAAKELNWCQQNQDAIVKKANKLYTIISGKATSNMLKRRCCNYKKLEAVLEKRKNIQGRN